MTKRRKSELLDTSSKVVLTIDERTVEIYLLAPDGTQLDVEKFKLAADADDIDHAKATRDVFDLLYQVALKNDAG
jgi:hypothetical protein